MIRYWTRFARTGDPNGPGSPGWTRVRDGRYVQSLAPGNGGIHPANLAQEHNQQFWQTAQ